MAWRNENVSSVYSEEVFQQPRSLGESTTFANKSSGARGTPFPQDTSRPSCRFEDTPSSNLVANLPTRSPTGFRYSATRPVLTSSRGPDLPGWKHSPGPQDYRPIIEATSKLYPGSSTVAFRSDTKRFIVKGPSEVGYVSPHHASPGSRPMSSHFESQPAFTFGLSRERVPLPGDIAVAEGWLAGHAAQTSPGPGYIGLRRFGDRPSTVDSSTSVLLHKPSGLTPRGKSLDARMNTKTAGLNFVPTMELDGIKSLLASPTTGGSQPNFSYGRKKKLPSNLAMQSPG